MFFYISFYMIQRPGYQGSRVPYKNWDVVEGGVGSAFVSFWKRCWLLLVHTGASGRSILHIHNRRQQHHGPELFFLYFLYLSVSLLLSYISLLFHCAFQTCTTISIAWRRGVRMRAYLCMLARYSCTLAFCIYRNTFSSYEVLIHYCPKVKSV